MTLGPAYFAYVGLLRRLHQLIAQGAGDSLDADAVRDAMDEPWAQMTHAEVEQANRLSASLYREPSGDKPSGSPGSSRTRVRARFTIFRQAA
jgi:hypothetical protein